MGSAMTMDGGIKRWAERMGASSALRNASSVNSPLSQHGGTGSGGAGGGGGLTKPEVNQALIPYGFVHEQIAYLTRVFCDDSTHAAVRSMDGLNRLGARRRTGCEERNTSMSLVASMGVAVLIACGKRACVGVENTPGDLCAPQPVGGHRSSTDPPFFSPSQWSVL